MFTLEQLEARFSVVEVPVTAGMNEITAMLWVDSMLLQGWKPTLNTIVRFDVTPQEFHTIQMSDVDTTSRIVVPAFGLGEVPVIFADTKAAKPGSWEDVRWELTSFAMGWWYEDAPVNDPTLMGPGPQYGQEFRQPDVVEALIWLSEGNDWWWV